MRPVSGVFQRPAKPRLVAKDKQGEKLIDQSWDAGAIAGVPDALNKVVEFLRGQLGGELPSAIGHRIVHGGIHYAQPTVICSEVLDVQKPGELEAVFEAIAKKWGTLDIVLHSIAFAPKEDLHGRVVDCSKDGFLLAMELSCWSFIRMAKLAEPLMKNGGTSSR